MKNLMYLTFFLLSAAALAQQAPGTSELVGNYVGIGDLVATAIAPGKAPGSERFYASYLYTAKSLDILSIDPETGNTDIFHSPVSGEIGARNLAVGPNGNVFLGTMPTAHLMKLDTKQGSLVDLGQPSKTEAYIWDATFGSDKRLYGATYPGCKLVRYDPSTGRMEDLGRLDPTEQYARFIVASNDGFLYIGIGSSKANIAAYDIRTGEHREILPADAQAVAIAKVYRGQDGNIYGVVGTRLFRLNRWTATELPVGQVIPPAAGNALPDGRTLDLAEKNGRLILTVTDPKTQAKTERPISYRGEEIALFRIGFGPDGVLYGSSTLPLDLVKIDIDNHHLGSLGNLGEGEVYSFLSHGQSLLMAAYSGLTTLMSYKPALSFQPAMKSGNPQLFPFRGDSPAWRPMAMINASDNNVYVANIASYGLLEAPLIKWNPENDVVQQFSGVARNQSIVSLSLWRNLVVGATSVYGGEGSHAVEKAAHLFMWDPQAQNKVLDVIPVPDTTSITDLTTAPDQQRIYGIGGDTFFAFDPAKRSIVATQKLPFSKPVFNCAFFGKDGRLWGLTEEGIFAIDTRSNKSELVSRTPEKITGGCAQRNGEIYFISGSAVYRYKM